jgi:FMN-dependent NADH-azoreductase
VISVTPIPQGLVEGKRVIIASSRGGVYSEGSPAEALDYQETYINGMFYQQQIDGQATLLTVMGS